MEQEQQIDMSKMSKAERRELKRRLKKERKDREQAEIRGAKNRKRVTYSALAILIIAALGTLVYLMGSAPGQYDSFARCLSSKGAVIYGNDYCDYTKQQMGMFGNSFGKLNYVKCAENEALCQSKGVSITPTWEINGQMYQGVQAFDKLSNVSGCIY